MKRSVVALTGILAASSAMAQDRLSLATVAVQPQEGVEIGFEIEIFADETAIARTREEWRGYRWIAVRTSEQDVARITSDECPILSELADAFRQLPPIQPATTATVVTEEPLPLNVIRLDGYSVELKFKTFSGADVRISGSDAYGAWGHSVVSDLRGCWSPTLPSSD